jgi:CarD family transcriptional regulator, regulator of rRNA transcription
MAQKKKVPVKAATRAKAAKAEARAPKKEAATAKSKAKATVGAATRTKKAATTASGRKAAPTAKTAAAKRSAATKKSTAVKKATPKVAKPAKKAVKATKPVAPAKKVAAKPAAAKANAARGVRPHAGVPTARKAVASAKPAVASRPSATTKVKAVAASAAKPPVKRQPATEGAKAAGKPIAGGRVKHVEVAPKKPVAQRPKFKTGEFIVYPAHGVGEIVAIEEQEIAGMTLELFVITFEKDKMTLRVPTAKLDSVGMRKLAAADVVEKALTTLKGRARVKRTMWSRRAQEYEQKINSGDLISIAEVVRDLYRSETQPEQSYSERQLYEAALDRMARELSAVENLDERGAVQRITDVLAKSAKGRRMAEEAAQEAEAAADNNKAA